MTHRRTALACLLVCLMIAIGCAKTPRIVAIGDLHGDLDACRHALHLAGAIDEQDRWIGGSLVVVQTGDILDRGDGELEILELLAQLQDEAAAAGGAVHVLNANHEMMNVAWRFHYVTEGGFEDFADTPIPRETVLDTVTAEHRGRAAAFRPGGTWARRLAEHPIILQLYGNVFVHGGVLPEHVAYGVDRLNSEVRAWLLDEGPEPKIIHTRTSPTWTRRYSDEPDSTAAAALDSVLTALGAERMVVGHTVQEGGIMSRFDGRVWCIDSGMSTHYGGPVEVLEIVGDRVRVLREQ